MIDTKGEKKTGLMRNKLKKKMLYLVGGAVRDHLDGKTQNDYDLATDATMDEIRLILQNAGFKESKPQTKVKEMEKQEGNQELRDYRAMLKKIQSKNWDASHASMIADLKEKIAQLEKLPSKGQKKPNYDHLPESVKGKKSFYIQGTDINGEEFVMGVKINNETFEVATFRKDAKGGDGRTTTMSFTPNLEEDAARRDFTINSMYIPLTNANGPNNKLIDLFNGIRDLKAKKVKFVGSAKDRLGEDQLRAMRYARFASLMGDTDTPEEIQKAIGDIKNLPSLQPFIDPDTGSKRDRRGRIRDEFLKGLKKEGIDPQVYVSLYKKLGLLDTVFPKMDFNLNVPPEFAKKDRRDLVIAWMLHDNNPDKVKKMLLDSHWSKEEATRMHFLLNFVKSFKGKESPEGLGLTSPEEYEKWEIDRNKRLHDMINQFQRSGFSSGYLQGKPSGRKSQIESWAAAHRDKFKSDEEFENWKKGVNAFLKHASHGPIRVSQEDPEFKPLFVAGPSGGMRGTPGIAHKQQQMAYNRFMDILQQLMPKNI
jgi:tRNA nucleotidyltransferase/poly(A) polymerase